MSLWCHMVTDYNDTSRLHCSLLGISVVCHNNYQRRDTPHLARFLRCPIHLVTHVVLISSSASHWTPGTITALLLAVGVTCDPHNKLGLGEPGLFKNTLICISLLWKQEMTLCWCHMTRPVPGAVTLLLSWPDSWGQVTPSLPYDTFS